MVVPFIHELNRWIRKKKKVLNDRLLPSFVPPNKITLFHDSTLIPFSTFKKPERQSSANANDGDDDDVDDENDEGYDEINNGYDTDDGVNTESDIKNYNNNTEDQFKGVESSSQSQSQGQQQSQQQSSQRTTKKRSTTTTNIKSTTPKSFLEFRLDTDVLLGCLPTMKSTTTTTTKVTTKTNKQS
eukprot:TRINITY_DN3573_c0_g1_i2.p1 TRINITY_DN3573_c0_g1~~TRINITY_DN3573_c0_g1_i2.p1  ORF type:complete len:185 (-),score=63.69 TRINITY_DN3573_c0_g1_i2:111-665(-)